MVVGYRVAGAGVGRFGCGGSVGTVTTVMVDCWIGDVEVKVVMFVCDNMVCESWTGSVEIDPHSRVVVFGQNNMMWKI